MKVVTKEINLNTKGETDIIDITSKIQGCINSTDVKDGVVTIFVTGSTGGITTIEYEPGLIKDIKEALERIAPRHGEYFHDARWGDGNGYAHVRAALTGASLTIPFSNQKLLLGTWQQIIFLDFDNRPRNRTIILQIIGS